MLQSSGPISLRDIGIEFDDNAPYKMSEFYGKGGVPTSGVLKFSFFYGVSNYLCDLVYSGKKIYVYTTKSTSVPAQYITTGIVDTLNYGNIYKVVSVSSPVGGTVTFDGKKIKFTSTDVEWTPASFNVTVSEQKGKLKTFTVLVTVLPPYVPAPPAPLGNFLLDDILGLPERIDDVAENRVMKDIFALHRTGIPTMS